MPLSKEELGLVFTSALFLRTIYTIAEQLVSKCRLFDDKDADKRRRVLIVRFVSFLHAFVTGGGSLLSFYYHPQLGRDPYGFTCDYARTLACISMGYFVHDISDMFLFGEWRSSKEYIAHHSLALGGFLGILSSECLYGVAMIGLLAEVHTVFLHLRTMMRLNGFNRSNSLVYRNVMVANFVALLVFRHLATTWLMWYLGIRAKHGPILLRVFLLMATSFLFYHNCHLQYRLLKTECYFDDKKLSRKEEDLSSIIDDEAIDEDVPPSIQIYSQNDKCY